jgi:hypothetical protein
MSKFPDPEGFGNGKHGAPTFDDSFCHVEIARTIIKHGVVSRQELFPGTFRNIHGMFREQSGSIQGTFK